MFRWQWTQLVSPRTRTDDAILRSSFSPICWQLALRTITSDVSRTSNLEVPLLRPEHDIYISTSVDPFFNLTLEDWYVSFLCADQAPNRSNLFHAPKHVQFIFYAFWWAGDLFFQLDHWQVIPTFPPLDSTSINLSWFSLRDYWSKSKSMDRGQFRCTPCSTYPLHT